MILPAVDMCPESLSGAVMQHSSQKALVKPHRNFPQASLFYYKCLLSYISRFAPGDTWGLSYKRHHIPAVAANYVDKKSQPSTALRQRGSRS